MKKYFIFSDVHGEFDGLVTALGQQGFEPENPDHILFSLGDLFDRGPKSYEVAKFLIKYWKEYRFIGIRGNHDGFYQSYLKDQWLGYYNIQHNGLGETLNSFAGTNFPHHLISELFTTDMLPKIQERLPDLEAFINSFKDKYEFGKYVFVHGGYSPSMTTDDWFIDNWANTPLWIKFFDPKDKTYVFGHWTAAELEGKFNQKKVDYGNVFIHRTGQFIGIDPTSIFSKKVIVLTMTEKNGEFKLSI